MTFGPSSFDKEPSDPATRIIRCRLLDQKNQTGIAFAYVEVPSLNLKLASNESGYFEFIIPTLYKSEAIELCIMPIYYEYKILNLDIRKAEIHEIKFIAHVDDALHCSCSPNKMTEKKINLWRKIKTLFF